MARGGSNIGGLIGALVGLGCTFSWCYFVYKAIRLDHWIPAAVGFSIPPIGIIGGALVWFGVIWPPETQAQASPPQATAAMARQDMMRSYATVQGMGLLVDRCRWQDVTARDRRVMSLIADAAKTQAKQAGATDQDLGVMDAGLRGTAGAMDCGDAGVHGSVQNFISDVKGQYGAKYDTL